MSAVFKIMSGASLPAVVLIGLSAFESPIFADSNSDARARRVANVVNRSGIPESQLGISIMSFRDSENIVFEQTADKKMIPASLSKIFTAGATLAMYPPGHKFVTELFVEGNTKGSTLEGDICLKGGGDPGFVSESMWFLINEFQREGISKISGNIKVDNSRFDLVYFDQSRLGRRVDRAYDSPVSAMSFNWNAVNFYVRPGSKVGEAAQVFADPENTYIEIVNNAKTVSGSREDIRISSVGLSKDGQTEKFLVNGSIGVSRSEKVLFRAISDPTIWTGKNLHSFLKQRGVEASDRVVKGNCGKNARLVAKSESRPLHWHVADMMKYSNNYVAEMLAKNIAVDHAKKQGSISAAMAFMREWMVKDLKFSGDDFKFVNPSGLTNDNLFRPSDVTRFLSEYKDKYAQTSEFMASFPIMGRDGTVKSRLQNTKGQDWIRAKTGMLSGVVALAGYAHYPDEPPMAFTFIYNGPPKGMDKARNVFDRILLALPQR